MKNHPLITYFVILIVLCGSVVLGAMFLGEQGAYLAQVYMLTPAIAAIITRLFFYQQRFRDANLRFGRINDYFKFWIIAIGITSLTYLFFTLLRAVTWDFSGDIFLERLSMQFEAVGQDMAASLPAGITPRMMLLIYFIGGLTVFNIIPGIITGFGEEFGHRGFMFPQLYKIRPWIGILIGGLIWYAWHLPLALIIPQTTEFTAWESVLNYLVLAVGSVSTFTYLAYVYVKSESIWVTSLAHIAINNSMAAFSYFVVLQNQLLANMGVTLAMVIVIAILYFRKELNIFAAYSPPEYQDVWQRGISKEAVR